MLYKSFVLSMFMTLSVLVNAQVTTLRFPESEYSFGTIKEEGGIVKHVFYFTNTGTIAAKLTLVRASCGCTIPTWNQGEIAPGKKDSIVVTFNPTNRPGPFSKEIYITANTNPSLTTLKIAGIVEPKPKTVEQEYPYVVGQTRFGADYVNFGIVLVKEPVVKELTVYNAGETSVNFLNNTALPAWVKVQAVPAQLAPKSKGVIKITYDPKLRNDYGYIADYIELLTNESTAAKKRIILSGTLAEYFPPVSAEQTDALPKASWAATEKDLGVVKPGSSVDFSYDFVNTGKQDLIIRAVKTGCPCTMAKADKTVIKPGETGHIVASFNTVGFTGVQQKTITVILNDTSNSQVPLYYRANITEPVAPIHTPDSPNGQ